MFKSRAAILASVLIAGAWNIPAQAGIVYDNGGPNIENGYGIYDTNAAADDFTLGSDTSITGVGFYFQNFFGITGWNQDISYNLYADDGGLLGILLASGTGQNVVATDSGLPWCCGGNAYLVTFNLQSAFAATANTTYWLELTGATGPAGDAYWVTADANATNSGLTGGFPAETEFAFYLTDDELSAVPEPSTLGIVGLGVLALPLLRRFRKSASSN
jgi:hypothetical protein